MCAFMLKSSAPASPLLLFSFPLKPQALSTYRQIFKALKLRRSFSVSLEKFQADTATGRGAGKALKHQRGPHGKIHKPPPKVPKGPKLDLSGLDRDVRKEIKDWVPTKRPDMKAGTIMRELRLALNQQRERVIGNIPGLEVGDRFKLREVSRCLFLSVFVLVLLELFILMLMCFSLLVLLSVFCKGSSVSSRSMDGLPLSRRRRLWVPCAFLRSWRSQEYTECTRMTG